MSQLKKGMPSEFFPAWKGDKVGYGGIHKWINNKKGKPKFCEICKTTNAKYYEWANKNHKYKRIIEDLMRLCISCHRQYDIKNNGYIYCHSIKKRKKIKECII